MTRTAAALVGVLASAASALAVIIGSHSGAAATFTTVNGCISNNIMVHTNTLLVRLHHRGEGAIESDITIQSRDTCSGLDLGTSSGNGDPARVAFTVDLNGASLTGAILVVDGNGTLRSVPVSLAWTGVGTIKRANTTTRVVTGDVTTTVHTRNASRNATVTGSVDGLPVDSADGMLFKDATVTQSRTK